MHGKLKGARGKIVKGARSVDPPPIKGAQKCEEGGSPKDFITQVASNQTCYRRHAMYTLAKRLKHTRIDLISFFKFLFLYEL